MAMFVSKKVFDGMNRDSRFLSRLDAAGVNDWEGYGEVDFEDVTNISEVAEAFPSDNTVSAREKVSDAVEIEDVSEFMQIANDSMFLADLEAAGVDNWGGYDLA